MPTDHVAFRARASVVAGLVIATLGFSFPGSASAVAASPTKHPLGLIRTNTYKAAVLPQKSGTASSSQLPVSVDLTNYAVPVGDQQSEGSCVSWAEGYSLYGWYANRFGQANPLHAPMYLYSQVSPDDTGSTMQAPLDVMYEQGVDTQSDYTQGNYDYEDPPTPSETANAYDYRISNYVTLFEDTQSGNTAQLALENQLASGFPAVIGIPVYPEFDYANTTSSIVDPPTPGEHSRGNHAVTALGYNSTGVVIENQWGTGWGDNGYATLSWAFVNSYVFDAETIQGLLLDGSSATTLSSSNNPASTGQAVTLTARVRNWGTPATGTVKFADGSTTIGSATLSADQPDVATVTTSTLNIGAHTIVATYSGAGPNAGSTSPTITETIVPATVIALTATPNPDSGKSVTLMATVTSPVGAAPTSGYVTFYDEGSRLSEQLVGPSGQVGVASMTTCDFSVGAHSLTAQFTGNPSYGDSTSSAYSEEIVASCPAPTITITSSANPSVWNQPVSITTVVTGLPNGPAPTEDLWVGVIDDTCLSAPGSNFDTAEGPATLTWSQPCVGSYSIQALYFGDGIYQSVLSTVFTQVVGSTPSAPKKLKVHRAGDGNVLQWTAPSTVKGSPPTGYTIMRSTTSHGESMLTTVPSTTETFVDGYVTEGVKYFYTVIATNVLGSSPPSKQVAGVWRPKAH